MYLKHFVLLLCSLVSAMATASLRDLPSRDHTRRPHHDVDNNTPAGTVATALGARDDNLGDVPYPSYPDVSCGCGSTFTSDTEKAIKAEFEKTLTHAPGGVREFASGGYLRHGPMDANTLGFIINNSTQPFKMDFAQFKTALDELGRRCGERTAGTIGKKRTDDSGWYGIGYMKKPDWAVIGSAAYHASFWLSMRKDCST